MHCLSVVRNVTTRLLSGVGLLVCTLGCDSSSPTTVELGTGAIQDQVGPGGKVLRGNGGTSLSGFVLEVPPGALNRLVRIGIEPGDPVQLTGTSPASQAVRITVTPDPGPLLRPAILRIRVGLPGFRDPSDLLLAGRRRFQGVRGQAPITRVGVLAESGTFQRSTRTFTIALRSLADLQVRLAGGRLTADAVSLVRLGTEALREQTDAALLRADQLFADAVRADPFHAGARVMRAMSRVAVALNDRTDSGPGVQSVGEVLQRGGFDVQRRSVLVRVLEDDFTVPAAPADSTTPEDLVAALQQFVRPALAASLQDLDLVSLGSTLKLRLPPYFSSRPGERELDGTDVLFLRALLQLTGYAIDTLEDHDLRADWTFLRSMAGQNSTIAAILLREANLLRKRTAPDDNTLRRFGAGIQAAAQAVNLLLGEQDSQTDDVVLFPSDFTSADQQRWRDNLQLAMESLQTGQARTLAFDSASASVDLLTGIRGGFYGVRDVLPAFDRNTPLGGTLPNPTFSGGLPGLTQNDAVLLFGLPNRATLTTATADPFGFLDWSKVDEALQPADRRGEPNGIADLDLHRLYAVRTDGPGLAFRLALHDGSFVYQPGRSRAYGVELCSFEDADADPVVVRVDLALAGPRLSIERGNLLLRQSITGVGIVGDLLEFRVRDEDLDRITEAKSKQLLMRGFAEGRDGAGNVQHDYTRAVLVRLP